MIVRASMPTAGWLAGPGTTMDVLNRNRPSATYGSPLTRSIVLVYELKCTLDLYLRDWATNTDMSSLSDIVAFNAAHSDKALRYGQDLFLAADATRGDLSELDYGSAHAMDLLAAKTRGMDAYMDRHDLDAVLFPGSAGAAIAAKAEYARVIVPAGFVSGVDGTDTHDYPLGVTFSGRALSEHKLLGLAHAVEQASKAREPPPGFGAH